VRRVTDDDVADVAALARTGLVRETNDAA